MNLEYLNDQSTCFLCTPYWCVANALLSFSYTTILFSQPHKSLGQRSFINTVFKLYTVMLCSVQESISSIYFLPTGMIAHVVLMNVCILCFKCGVCFTPVHYGETMKQSIYFKIYIFLKFPQCILHSVSSSLVCLLFDKSVRLIAPFWAFCFCSSVRYSFPQQVHRNNWYCTSLIELIEI